MKQPQAIFWLWFELWHGMKSGFYTTTSSDQLSSWTKRKLQNNSQSQSCTKKKSHGHCLVVCYQSDPRKLSESQWNHYLLRSMLSKWMRCPENCSAHSWLCSTERAQFFSMTMPNCTWHNQHFKSWMNWATKLCFICHIHLTSRQQTITSSSISTTFWRENASTTRRTQKMLSKSSLNLEVWIFMLQE